MSRKQYDALRTSYKSVGELSSFAREFDSNISTDKEKIFHTENLVYLARPIKSFISRAIALDPAISEEAHADFCAFAVVGMEQHGILHVLDFYMKRGMSPENRLTSSLR